jgi:thiosulfate dehydrogenase
MKLISTYISRGVRLSLVCSALAASTGVLAYPFTDEQIAEQEKALLESVNQGYDLWHGSKPEMTTNGLACGNCHPDAAASNPQTFPKYVPMFGKVVPFREMVNWCIENPQVGEALDVNGDEMTAMEAYAFKLHRTRPIEPGLASRQTQPIVVEGGKGYAWEPSGIGVDK